MSERRACKAIGFCRMTIRYETRRSDDHGLRERMKALAHECRRFGYRRIHVLLKPISASKVGYGRSQSFVENASPSVRSTATATTAFSSLPITSQQST